MTSVQGQGRGFPGRPGRGGFILVCAVLLLLGGCASVPRQIHDPADSDSAWVLSGAGLLPPDGAPVEEPAALMHVSPEMHRYVEAVMRDKSGDTSRLYALIYALGSPAGLNLRYDSAATLTAEQAFAEHRVNCLSYALLFSALARDAGLRVRFNDVDIPPLWDLGNARTSLLYRHLNLEAQVGAAVYQVVDVSAGEYDPSFPQHIISDTEAEAQFYNNRAMELLLEERLAAALRYELRALQLAPSAGYLWANLASIYQHAQALRAARIAIDRALSLDSSALLAYETGAQIYDALHQKELAASLHRRAREFLEQNPYYHYQLALAALDRRDEAAAYDEIGQAIGIRPEEPRFLFLQALLLNRRGETQLAEDDMRTVMNLTRSQAQQERYRDKFARLKERPVPVAASKS